jgi:hypothetical protein
MAYPEPIEMESAESLYKQAKFFYDEYEKEKKKNAEMVIQNKNDRCLLVNELAELKVKLAAAEKDYKEDMAIMDAFHEEDAERIADLEKKMVDIRDVAKFVDSEISAGYSGYARRLLSKIIELTNKNDYPPEKVNFRPNGEPPLSPADVDRNKDYQTEGPHND